MHPLIQKLSPHCHRGDTSARSDDLFRYIQTGFAFGLLLFLSQCSSLRPVPTVAFTDHRHAMLFEELVYEDASTTTKIVVPTGFVTDHASIPGSVKRYFESGGMAYQYPAIVHDWLYWSQTTTRKEADRVFDAAMKDCGVGDMKRRTISAAVRAGGSAAWEQNRQEREQGLIKVIPEAHRSPKVWPENITWPQYRRLLYEQGVREGITSAASCPPTRPPE